MDSLPEERKEGKYSSEKVESYFMLFDSLLHPRSHARDRAINLMNEEGKEATVDFLLQHLEVEGCNAHHKSLSQLDSNNTVNMVAYD